MTVVSNTSPLIALAEIGQLALLQQLYGKVTVPGAVFDEIVIAGAGAPGATDVESAIWINTIRLEDTPLLRALRMELDAGEAEAIACAVQARADWLLIDERRGRSAAERLGLRVIGTLGVLIAAKRAGYLAEVKTPLNALRNQAGLWMSDELMRRALAAAEEAP